MEQWWWHRQFHKNSWTNPFQEHSSANNSKHTALELHQRFWRKQSVSSYDSTVLQNIAFNYIIKRHSGRLGCEVYFWFMTHGARVRIQLEAWISYSTYTAAKTRTIASPRKRNDSHFVISTEPRHRDSLRRNAFCGMKPARKPKPFGSPPWETASQRGKKFPTFYRTRRFTAMLTTPVRVLSQLNLFQAPPIPFLEDTI